MDFRPNFTEREKNQFARQYESLVRKLVKQTVDKGFNEWDQIESAAWEGFARAKRSIYFLRDPSHKVRDDMTE